MQPSKLAPGLGFVVAFLVALVFSLGLASSAVAANGQCSQPAERWRGPDRY